MDLNAIRSLGGKDQGNYFLIRCPFHNDNSPSCSVKMVPPYQGAYKCWSCGAKGGYKKLAAQLGISGTLEETSHIDVDRYEEEFFKQQKTHDSSDLDLYSMSAKNLAKIGINDTWRDIPITFLRDYVQAKISVDQGYQLYFPVLVKGIEVGYIMANLKKSSTKGVPSYINKKGTWSRTKGLFLFDQALTVNPKVVILVEGPRDAIRLAMLGLPAVAILGTQSWSDSKRRVLELSGVTDVILAFDGDDAGHAASIKVTDSMEGYLSVTDFKLYEWEGEYDPCNMPPPLIKKLKKLYQDTCNELQPA